MEVLEQLRQEAERRASTPEGLLALADLLLVDYQQILDLKPCEDYCFIGINEIANFFGKIQSENRAVNYCNFNIYDFEDLFGSDGKLRPQVEVEWCGSTASDVVWLWAAEMCSKPTLARGQMEIIDSIGIHHWRQIWKDPRARMSQLLRQYVLVKRQCEYFYKAKAHGSSWAFKHPTQMDSFYTVIGTYRQQIRDLTEVVGEQTALRWKREIGPTLTYGCNSLRVPYALYQPNSSE